MLVTYEALDDQGRLTRDQMEAVGTREAVEHLRRQGLFVTDIRQASENANKQASGTLSLSPRLPLKVLVMFTRQLAMLLRSGSGLVPAIAALKRQMGNQKYAVLLGQVVTDLEDGVTLAHALRKHPGTFDSVYCAIVSAGEATGNLAQMFDRLAEIVGKRRAMRNKVLGAAAYPALLVFMCTGILQALLVFVLPRFKVMFDQLGIEPPPTTQFLLRLGEGIQTYWPHMLVSLGLMVAAIVWLLVTPRGRQWISDVQISIPLLGRLRSRLIQGQIFRTMGMLLESGVGVLETLNLARGSTSNRRFQKMFDDVEKTVTSGGHPSAAFEDSGLVEPYICQAIHTGEESGNLGGAMTFCADVLDESNDELVKTIVRLLEPIILIVMGVVVGGVAVSLFLPMFDMTAALQ